MRAAGYQAKTACGNLQLCAGLESRIEGETHAVVHRRLEISRARRSKEVAVKFYEGEESESVGVGINHLTIETVVK